MTRDRNRDLAEQINAEALANPDSPYAGKFVGVVGGRVVVVAQTLDELGQRLDAMSADSKDTFWVEASRDYSLPEYIWSIF